MRHLFVAPLGSAFGEALHGIRIARQLVAAGHEVVVLAPAAMHPLIDDAPVMFGRIDLALPHLDAQLGGLIRRLRCDTVVLVDAAAVGKVARALHLDVRAFTHPGVPVIALDCWNLPAQPIVWDYGVHATEMLSREIHAIERRLIPVPIAALDTPGGFAALPVIAPSSRDERIAVRAELGLHADDRLIVWPSASWQHAESHTDPKLASLAAALPALILPRLDRLGPSVHIAHVGPHPFADAVAHATRYRYLAQLAPRRFERLIAAADLVIGFNMIASSIATAIAARTPVLVGTSEIAATTTEGLDVPVAVRAALDANLPLTPILAWPLRLDTVLGPTLSANPLLDAIRRVEVFDEAAYVRGCRELLFDSVSADAHRHRQDGYARRVAALPAGHERLIALL